MTNRQIGFIVLVVALLVIGTLFLTHRSAPIAAAQPEQEPEVTVKFGKITRTTLHAYVSGFGTVAPEPATNNQPPASAKIGSAVSGLLAESRAVEGERVPKGATLFQLDTRVADVQVEKARQAVEFTQHVFDRQKQLLSTEGTSKKLYQEAEQQLQAARYELANATAQRALLTIQAPIAGTVVHVMAKPGDAIDPATPLAEIIDLERLVVTAKIRTQDVAVLRLGQRAEVSPGRPEAADQAAQLPPTATATVSYIGADVDQTNDTVPVRASLPARSGLRPGQFVSLRVLTGERRDCLVVPMDGVVSDVGSSGAFIAVVTENVAVRRPVKLGVKDNGLVEIEGEGIRDGAVIVTTGAYGLPDHTRVRQVGQ